ncbi:MAG: glycosyltransferase [Thermomicrobiales bacterium]|nr:glycosyltransferase [Thermomicrobiales bacterium]
MLARAGDKPLLKGFPLNRMSRCVASRDQPEIRRTASMIRIVFLIGSLHRGGAEKQLTLLVRGLDHSRFHCTVVTIYGGGQLAHELDDIENVEVISIHKGGRSDSIPALLRLRRLVTKLNPDIVHGYLDSANVLALFIGKSVRTRVVWGVRSSTVDPTQLDIVSRIYCRLGSLLSSRVDLVIANSTAGQRYVTALGYPADRVIAIPNGFETGRFERDMLARSLARKSWGIADDTPVVGLVARLDPIKDHPTFLRAAALLLQQEPEVRFVCVGGGGSPEYERELRQLARDLSIEHAVIWAGETADMPAAQNGLDVASLVSVSEGFANAIGEAMACAVPCVVTDVGDSAAIVGETGIVVPPGNPEALRDAWQALLELTPDERGQKGARARLRILEHYSVEALVGRTTTALLSLLSNHSLDRDDDITQPSALTSTRVDEACRHDGEKLLDR